MGRKESNQTNIPSSSRVYSISVTANGQTDSNNDYGAHLRVVLLLSSILDLYIFVRNNCFGELDSHDRRVSKQFVHTKYALNLHTNPITYIYYTFLLNGIKKDDY